MVEAPTLSDDEAVKRLRDSIGVPDSATAVEVARFLVHEMDGTTSVALAAMIGLGMNQIPFKW